MNISFLHLYLRRFFLHRKTFCVLSNNCVSGTIYTDMKKQYLTPTIWVHMDDNDFVSFVSNPSYYLSFDLIEYKDPAYINSVCGYLGNNKPVHFHFFHNKTFESAKETWDRRKARLSLNNIYIVWSSKNPQKEDIETFKHISYCKNKVLLTSKNNKSIVKGVPHKFLHYFDLDEYFSGFELQIKRYLFFFKRRYLDSWNYVWFLRKR